MGDSAESSDQNADQCCILSNQLDFVLESLGLENGLGSEPNT